MIVIDNTNIFNLGLILLVLFVHQYFNLILYHGYIEILAAIKNLTRITGAEQNINCLTGSVNGSVFVLLRIWMVAVKMFVWASNALCITKLKRIFWTWIRFAVLTFPHCDRIVKSRPCRKCRVDDNCLFGEPNWMAYSIYAMATI